MSLAGIELLSATPSNAPRATPLLFVHGAWHGAWCWENFLPFFAAHGYAAYALSMRGHGASAGRASLRWHSAARDYVADLAAVAAALPTPPVLIGHSMGGYVVQKYLETHDAPGAVLLASIPTRGTSGFTLRYTRRHPRAAFRAILTADPGHLVGTPELAADTFFSPNLPAHELSRHFARLGSESALVLLETGLLALPRPYRVHTPLLVLGAANDQVFTQAEVEATARAYGTTAEFFPMAHDVMLEQGWENVAARIINWLGYVHQ